MQEQKQEQSEQEHFDTIFQEKPAKMLLKIHEIQNQLHRNKKPNIAEIKREIDTTQRYSTVLVQKLSPKLIKTQTKGASKRLSLTPRGEEAVRKIRELQQTLGGEQA